MKLTKTTLRKMIREEQTRQRRRRKLKESSNNEEKQALDLMRKVLIHLKDMGEYKFFDAGAKFFKEMESSFKG